MNKSGILNYYSTFVDDEGVFYKTLDQLIQTHKYYEVQVTDFLTPDLIHVFRKIAVEEAHVLVEAFGVFDHAERMKLCFYPEYMAPVDPAAHISLIQFDYNDKFNKLAHKDVLGALMALGIQRKKIGDILVETGSVQVAVDSSLESYFLTHIDQIGRAGVKSKKVDFSEKFEKDLELTMINGTVKSMRLDALIAMALKISRSDALKLVESELVKVNYRQVVNGAFELNVGDLISVRKHGRFMVKEIFGQTKKDRIRIELAFYSR